MTAQVSERLIYGGKEIALFSNPLSLYLQQTGTSFESPHTACWRGYVGTWEIIESGGVERMYLVSLEKVFAHWFSGELRCPQGEMLDYVHGGYASTYEYDLLMEFKQGVLVNKHARHNKPPPKKDEKDYPSFLRRGNV
jgi:hypothetical protein